MSCFEQKQQVLTTDHAVQPDYLVLATGTSSNDFESEVLTGSAGHATRDSRGL